MSNDQAANYDGTIHFPDAYAYYQDNDQTIWALIQSDSPYTGVLDWTKAADTATALGQAHGDGDAVTLHGILKDVDNNGAALTVLFLF